MAKRVKIPRDSTTPRWQRWAIWIITIVMTVGTITTFVVAIIANQNPDANPNVIAQQAAQKYQDELQQRETDHTNKVNAQNAELSKTYYAKLKTYKSKVAAWDGKNINNLAKDDLATGDGAEITADNGAAYAMYYIGWEPDGTIFDSSFDGDSTTLKTPLSGSGSYIQGWSNGVIGMKIGGARQLTIPADQAYGDQGSGTKGQSGYIAPDTPLKFIVLAIPVPAAIKYPAGTMDLCKKAYAQAASQYGTSAQALCESQGFSDEE
ncbi:MAG: FKBP-type peptidyl-prolyl cis-trans isomerase [Candidatus Nomurabacteria bacterium]|jgi:FKBP-type peptidyl-prolyl cis-trans isomerase|nr:FKBP-type peptidyl-prolyl cis-trans isomerase [Candidatus Nomurabacteria bacterium]